MSATDQLLSESPAPLRRVITPDDVNRAMAEQYSQPQTPRIDLEPTIDFGDELRWLAWTVYSSQRGWRMPR